MEASQYYSRLRHEVETVRRQWRWAKLLEGFLLAAAGVVAIVIFLVAVDNLFRLGVFGRLLLACLLWGGLAAGLLFLVLRRWLQDRRDDFFAAMVEHRHPELHNGLINALQLGRGEVCGSAAIVDAIVSDAAAATVDLEMSDCLDWKPVRRAALLTGAALLLIVLYAVIFTPRFTNSLGRLLLPIADIKPYTSTVIDRASVQPAAGKRFPEGTSIAITADIGGDHLPDSARVYRSRDGRNWRSQSMQLAADRSQADRNSFQFVAADVDEGFQFYIAAGDDQTAPRQVEIVKRPRLDSLRLTLEPPAYVGLEPQTTENAGGELAALSGTRVSLRIKTTKSLDQATLETESGQVIRLEGTRGSDVWLARFEIRHAAAPDANGGTDIVQAPTRYRFRLLDTDGYENMDPMWYPVTLIRDRPPTVAIVVPGRDEQIEAGNSLPLAVDARDDFGIGDVRIVYRVNNLTTARQLVRFPRSPTIDSRAVHEFDWDLGRTGIGAGDVVQYWATVTDRNDQTGPGTAESRRYSIFVVTPEQELAKLQMQLDDYAAVLEELIRLQRSNRAQTASGIGFETLVLRQIKIRTNTAVLARAMRQGTLPVATMIEALDELYAGLMADVVRLLETGGATNDDARAAMLRNDSLPVQDEIIAVLEDMLRRLQRNDQARRSLRRIRDKDEAAHKELSGALVKLLFDLNRLTVDETEMASKLEKMPKRPVDEFSEEELKNFEQFEEFRRRWSKWQKGAVDELAKLPTGFVDDFGLREDINTVFEEVEPKPRKKATDMDISIEDMGVSGATTMKEDLEVWLLDKPDYLRWNIEDPLENKPMNFDEMPLPDVLEDLIGELLQEEEDFDEEADDATSAWGENLDQAGWGVMDGSQSNFSAKGKTGNDIPNTNELTGRSGDGRRGKASGQMVGETARGLEGRKTPARLNKERYEEGKLEQEGQLDPNGSTGGGKKAGSGRKGLQGGTPPDFVRDLERLSAKQMGTREKAERIAKELDTASVTGRRLDNAIELMKSVETDLRDLRYEDASRKRKVAIGQLKAAVAGLDETTALSLHQARELPAKLRDELLQSTDDGYPQGYETLLEQYYRTLAREEDM
ncbi:MAG: hypothetical protein QGF67_11515 [Lentisphaeria bacterium]|nr:hypothetical protein [Lentisphaeria bacterium]